jgi:hypothetical protein
MNDRHALHLSSLTLIGLVFAASPAVADVGPKLTDAVVVTVTNMAVPVPQLDTSNFVAPSGKVWTYAGYLWGGENKNGKFRFNGFQPVGGKPDQVRVAISRRKPALLALADPWEQKR